MDNCRTIKILHFSHSFFPVYGGTSTRNYHLLHNDGMQHYVYVPQAPISYIPSQLGRLRDEDTFDNIKILRIGLTPDVTDKLSLFHILPYFIQYIFNVKSRAERLLKAVQQENYQIIYGHSPLEFGLAAYWYARKNRLPMIYEAHSFLYDSLFKSIYTNNYKSWYLTSLYKNILFNYVNSYEKKIISFSSCVVAQTKNIQQKLMDIYKVPKEKILIVVNGVDSNFFQPKLPNSGNIFSNKYSMNKKIKLLYAGFLNSINGIDFLLSVFKELSPKIKAKLHLFIAGRGPMQEEVEKVASQDNAITYLGLIKYEDMPDLYNFCDLFIIPRPSVKESEEFYPMKILEVMACQKPVLVSDVAPMLEIVKDKITGFVYRKGDKESFLSVLKFIIDNSQMCQNISKNARKYVTEFYNWGQSKRLLIDTYKKFII